MKYWHLSLVVLFVVAVTACASRQPQTARDSDREYEEFFAKFETEAYNNRSAERPRVFVCVNREMLDEQDWGTFPCFKHGEPHLLEMIHWEARHHRILVEVGSANTIALRYADFERFGSIADARRVEHYRASVAVITEGLGHGNAAEPIEEFVLYAGGRYAVLDLRLPGTWMTKEAEHGGLVEFFVPGFEPAYLTIQRVPLAASYNPCEMEGPRRLHPVVHRAMQSGACPDRQL